MHVDLPSLTHLELVDTRVSWQSSVFKSTLTHLTFRSGDTPYEYLTASITTVLRALEGMPALQNLELKGVLPSLPDDTPPLINDLMVNLPHLRTLLLGSSAKTCAFVLQHMAFPADVTLQLDCTDLRSNEVAQLCPVLSSKLRSDPEHGIVVPPLLTLSINETSLKAWTQDYPISVLHPVPSSAIPPKAQPKLCITMYRPSYGQTTLLNVVLDTLPIANVRTLYLGAHDHTMEKKEWLRMCGRMTGLRELDVGRFGETGLPEALAGRVPAPATTPPVPAQGSSEKPRRKMQPFLPGLRTLQLTGLRLRRTAPDVYGADADAGLLPQYTKMLATRRRSKCPLVLRLRDCMNVCQDDIVKLRKDAASVEWDGAENWDDEDEYDEDDEELYGDPYYDEDFSDDDPPFFFFPW
ncbi:hypothetical protein PsYK624_073460 [Phanerochaete sordida]|uniref:F-box domain-containing protein n=1 Tax=Phanerochaete sordida TaxID=48140 RepID=A0A9P3LEP3_9APHY|nr:hypothetical protein PsYK624_073460 [Phanerochaete sordida]